MLSYKFYFPRLFSALDFLVKKKKEQAFLKFSTVLYP